jgi:hypothetical protein
LDLRGIEEGDGDSPEPDKTGVAGDEELVEGGDFTRETGGVTAPRGWDSFWGVLETSSIW